MAVFPVEEYFGEKLTGLTHLWVFGYGSILWKTGFSYKSMQIGCVPGYVRRFWQGSTTHRGTPTLPGRVATLIEDSEGEVWGGAYELEGKTMVQKALDHLGLRECGLGGYVARMVPFKSRTSEKNDSNCSSPPACSMVLVFQATPTNDQYLGPASIPTMANQIVACRGSHGYNVEYVTRLADYVRAHIPEDTDPHLLALDSLIRTVLDQKNIRLEKLLSNYSNSTSTPPSPTTASNHPETAENSTTTTTATTTAPKERKSSFSLKLGHHAPFFQKQIGITASHLVATAAGHTI